MAKDTSLTARRKRRFSPDKTRCSGGSETSKSCVTCTAFRIGRSVMGCVQPAGRPGLSGREQIGLFVETSIERPVAARMEGTAGGNRTEPRHRPVDLPELIGPVLDGRNAAHQP